MAIMSSDLEHVLQRSEALDAAILEILNMEAYEPYDDSSRVEATLGACAVALEHGVALRVLMAANLPTSAISMMRLQHEALTRGLWLLYAASEEAVAKVQASLSTASERAAKNLAGLAEMLAALKGKGPPGATDMLTGFKNVVGQEGSDSVLKSSHHRNIQCAWATSV